MINVFRASGFTVVDPGDAGLDRGGVPDPADRRGRRSVRASRDRGGGERDADVPLAEIGRRDRRVARSSSIGGRLFHNLLMSEFHGAVYPVNPKADVVHGVVAYPTVTAVPGEVDVAFVVVPATHVSDVARECGAKGVRGLVVISAGFAEVGGDGPARQDDLVQICRDHGMRIIGPNCMGIVNTSDEVRLNGTFAPVYPPRGGSGSCRSPAPSGSP